MRRTELPRPGWTAMLKAAAESCAGWLVLVAVLVLLEGPTGTWAALSSQSTQFIHTFIGSDRNEISAVAVKTLPLVLATAVMTFLMLRRWLPEGMGRVYLAAIVIVATGWVARELSATFDVRSLAAPLSGALAEPDQSPLARLLPDDAPGMLGLVVRGARELSNYLWQYGWNLSAAALVVGAFAGWKLHRRLAVVEKGMEVLQEHRKRAA